MTALLVILLIVHALSALFWAGITLTLARMGAAGAGLLQFARPQAGAAAVTILAGIGLWGVAHRGPPSSGEWVLSIGALCAVAAAGLQHGMAWRAARRAPADPGAGAAFARGQRLAAVLLSLAMIAMVTFRYA
jgi:hypothetical protein